MLPRKAGSPAREADQTQPPGEERIQDARPCQVPPALSAWPTAKGVARRSAQAYRGSPPQRVTLPQHRFNISVTIGCFKGASQ